MFVAFNDANEVANRFLALLNAHDISPPIGSSLESELLSVFQLIEIGKNPNIVAETEQAAILNQAAGIYDLAAKVMSIETIAEFNSFIPHLKLIAESKFEAASIRQNAAVSNDTARKMAELYVGCLAAHVGTNVILDHPTASRGDNPDIIFTVEETTTAVPRQWALAIKSISSRSGQTIFERIKEGARQIDDDKCPAHVGMVLIHASSALDHKLLWETSFPYIQPAIDALTNQVRELANSSAENRPAREWDDLFLGRVVRPVLFLGQSVVRVDTQLGTQIPTPLKILMSYDAQGVLDLVGLHLAAKMNDFMQDITKGICGGPGQLPS